MSFTGPLWVNTSPDDLARYRALAEHSPPALIWFDAAGGMRTRCITDDPNPHCVGCRETETPPGEHWRFTPPGG